jgi:cytochrome c oxidase cbb3-type subunit III
VNARACLCVALLAAFALAGCERESRSFGTPKDNSTSVPSAPRASTNQPAVPLGGDVKQAASDSSPYDDNAYAVAQGKRLYRWYNCNGCHANGGGGMGPALMDAEWRYGSSPAQVFDTIVQGRPNGMPSFGGHIPEDQVWQIVAYVRSMGGQLRKDVSPSRSDTLYPGLPENARPPHRARAEQQPPEQPTGGPQR